MEKSPDYPGFFSLDYIIETLNNDTVAYPPPTRTFISQLERYKKTTIVHIEYEFNWQMFSFLISVDNS